MLLVLVVTACGNDDEPEATATLDVKGLVGYVGQTPDYVKANLKGATLNNERPKTKRDRRSIRPNGV